MRKEEILLLERAKKDKLFTIRPGYVEICGAKNILTGKFYSRDQAVTTSKLTSDQERVFALQRRLSMAPNKKYPCSITESQEYGWYPPLIWLDPNDRRFCKRRRTHPDIKLADAILTIRKKNKM